MNGTTYTPADLGAAALAGATSALPWVAAAIAAAIGIMFTFIGIRKAVGWGASIVADERAGGGSLSSGDAWALGVVLNDPVNRARDAEWSADFEDGRAWGDYDRAVAYADKEEANRDETRLRRAAGEF